MPNWSEILQEIHEEGQRNPKTNPLDTVRRKYLTQISTITGRNTIAYYSGWLQKHQAPGAAVNDKDKSGFMLCVNKLDRSRGLDLILHTPGGDIAATESLVDYLYNLYDKDIRAIVPQISMSAGTMMALSCKSIIMGKQSNLGPIDPQFNGIPCQAVIKEFQDAKEDLKTNPHAAPLWKSIIGKYHPTFLGSCEHAISWSEQMVTEWLKSNMCKDKPEIVDSIVHTFSNHDHQKSHSRHISKDKCKEAGLEIIDLEDDQNLQDAVLTTHHAFMHTFANTPSVKIIENEIGVAYVEQASLPTPQR